MNSTAVTCHVQYQLDPEKLREFEAYARIWIRLVERYGGVHHGYFMPGTKPAEVNTSFAIGREGPANAAVALFTFASEEAYRRYREAVATDPECKAAEALLHQTHCL